MIIRVLLVSFVAMTTLANYPYFKFDHNKLKLHKDSYYRYIRPQLRNIKAEYYHISKKISPIHSGIIKLRERSLKLKMSYKKGFKVCKQQQREQVYCDINVTKILPHSYRLDQEIMQLRSFTILKGEIDNSKISSYILFTKNLDEIEVLNSKIQRFLELRKIVENTPYMTYTTSFTDLSNTVNRLFFLVNFAYIDMLPKDLQSHFESLLIHFITPLEERMIVNFSPAWFKRKLGSLNLTWNTFHMNLEKGQTTFPRKLIKIVKIMHNRWNSILKIMF